MGAHSVALYDSFRIALANLMTTERAETLRCRSRGGGVRSLQQVIFHFHRGGDHAMTTHSTTSCVAQSETKTAANLVNIWLDPIKPPPCGSGSSSKACSSSKVCSSADTSCCKNSNRLAVNSPDKMGCRHVAARRARLATRSNPTGSSTTPKTVRIAKPDYGRRASSERGDHATCGRLIRPSSPAARRRVAEAG
jgi:hypothetical protein